MHGGAAPGDLRALRDRAAALPPARLGLVCAEDPVALTAASAALEQGMVELTLFGDRERIAEHALDGLLERADVVDAADVETAAALAARAAGSGEIDLLLKGKLRTDQLLRAVLSPEAELRSGGLLSDVLVYEDVVGGRRRLVGVTDGGLVVAPTLAHKREIIRNAVRLFHALGFAEPRIALLSATEVPTSAMPSSVEARTLSDEAKTGAFGRCQVCGPLALDNALLPEAAAAKGIDDPVAGHADCLVAPTIEAGNILGKASKFFAGSVCGHVVLGARVPILIPSRVESAEDKLTSIALGVIAHADA
jgi:phosphate butyryltransferase